MSQRRINTELIYQGKDKAIRYSLDVSEYGSSPTSVVVTAHDTTDNFAIIDVSSTVLNGTYSIDGNVILLPLLEKLQPDHLYRVEVKFSTGGNTYEPFLLIKGEY